MKKEVEYAKEEGVIGRINVLLSAAYMLNSEVSILTAMTETLLERYGLKLGSLKWRLNNLNGAFDMYCREFSSLVTDEEMKECWMRDVSELHKLIFTWQGIPEEWKPGDPQYLEYPYEILAVPKDKSKKEENDENTTSKSDS